MKRYIVFILMALLCASCEKTIEVMRIVVENDTGKNISIKLFPKSEYLGKNGDYYHRSDINSGSHCTEFELGFDTLTKVIQESLYTCDEIGISPIDLATRVFDSIIVVLENDQKTTMVFTHESVEGYARNLFTDDSVWSYELKTYYEPVGLSRTYIEAHEYTFTFKEENIE